jgi:type II secretory pathway component PulF
MDSLAACRDVVRNRLYRDLYVSLEQQVQHGQGLASGYLSSEYVPPLVQQMIATGEESGSLAMVMSRIAGFYEIRLEKRLQAMSKAAEPLMLLIMGVVVGVLVSSLILPIFKLSRAVG